MPRRRTVLTQHALDTNAPQCIMTLASQDNMDGVGGNAIMLPAAPSRVMTTPGKGQGGGLRQTYRVEVSWKSGPDGRAHTLLNQIRELGIENVKSVRVSSLYFLRGPLDAEQVDLIATTLLMDPIVEAYHASASHHCSGDPL